jgi:hypothetical protein
VARIVRLDSGYINLNYLITARPDPGAAGGLVVTMERGDPLIVIGEAADHLRARLDALARADDEPQATNYDLTANLTITPRDPADLTGGPGPGPG